MRDVMGRGRSGGYEERPRWKGGCALFECAIPSADAPRRVDDQVCSSSTSRPQQEAEKQQEFNVSLSQLITAGEWTD